MKWLKNVFMLLKYIIQQLHQQFWCQKPGVITDSYVKDSQFEVLETDIEKIDIFSICLSQCAVKA